ncbi:MAG: succinate dehydrogenase, hydrophobic membrane anchor protein [Bacteroidota bacterium]|nr:succinate dehydrogenase, hydrophobic membrane anchor protein [Bacteroidota bacterium]MDP4234026.1 succinate dehydrogenase, hydrophobic membrane anchor protein [Bacteroidota bacterium]MDP4242892.1 succinate dehydrogenase, hydrophobic membrane anchor protein [Bacteroidota bacterium]MDP4287669.1 succinate dehydrogenase, hydrophobic membrane anchor protein [Bacteroidota bacterium]
MATPTQPFEGTRFLRSYSRPKSSGASAWWLVRISGIALIPLLVGHYILMHYNPASGHDYGETASRLASPWFKGLYLGFITIGMYHGLVGIWNIMRDYKMKPLLGRTLFGLLVVAGIIFVAVGWNTILTFDPLKP